MLTHNLQIKGREYSLLSLQRTIVTEIKRLSKYYYSSNKFYFDQINMATPIINILSDSQFFHVLSSPTFNGEIYGPIGLINNMGVYIDHSLNRNQIKMMVGIEKLRDLKIESLFNTDQKIFEIFLDIDSDLI